MSDYEWVALAGFAFAAIVMLLITQTKERVSWPGWFLPAFIGVAFAAWTASTIGEQGLAAYSAVFLDSRWGLQVWLDRLLSVTAAFFLLQNRARAAGMKSEVWVLVIIFTSSIGLLLMLARTLQLERAAAIREPEGATVK
jgi:hypothetical protein